MNTLSGVMGRIGGMFRGPRLYSLVFLLVLLSGTAWAQTLGRATYVVDPTQSDQGVLGNYQTIASYLAAIGTSKSATLYFRHTGLSDTTLYTVTTSIDFTNYPNIYLEFEQGARLAGAGNVKIYTPDNVRVGGGQDWSDLTGSLTYYIPGVTGYLEGSDIGVTVQAWDTDLDTWATVTPSTDGKALVSAVDYATMKGLLDLEIGTDVQAYDADLTTYAGITPSVNVQTMLGSADNAEILSNIGADMAYQPLATDLTNLVSQWAVDGSGNVSGMGTVSAGAAGFTVDADGDTVAKSVTIAKQSGVAGIMGVYEGNSTDTNISGFQGPANSTESFVTVFPSAKPAPASGVYSFLGSPAQSSGDGSNTNPYRHSGSWVNLYQYHSKSVTILGAVADTDDFPFWRAPAAITLRAVHCVNIGGTNVIGQLQECDANGASCADTDSDITCTTSNTNDDGSLSNASIDAGDYVGWKTTSVSGTTTSFVVTFEYTYD